MVLACTPGKQNAENAGADQGFSLVFLPTNYTDGKGGWIKTYP